MSEHEQIVENVAALVAAMPAKLQGAVLLRVAEVVLAGGERLLKAKPGCAKYESPRAVVCVAVEGHRGPLATAYEAIKDWHLGAAGGNE